MKNKYISVGLNEWISEKPRRICVISVVHFHNRHFKEHSNLKNSSSVTLIEPNTVVCRPLVAKYESNTK